MDGVRPEINISAQLYYREEHDVVGTRAVIVGQIIDATFAENKEDCSRLSRGCDVERCSEVELCWPCGFGMVEGD